MAAANDPHTHVARDDRVAATARSWPQMVPEDVRATDATEPIRGAYRSRTGGKLRNTEAAECAVLQPLRGSRPAFVVSETGCWVWQGSLNSKGYALRRSAATGHLLVHRAVYEHVHGALGVDEQIHHRCENKACVNPEHLEARQHLEHERLHAGADCAAAIILRELASGTRRYRDLAAAIGAAGMSAAAASVALRRMVSRGELVQLRRGVYALPVGSAES